MTLHLSNNIKKIRDLYAETQPVFAERMGVSLAMQKTYEGKTIPGITYMEKLSDLSGIEQRRLRTQDIPLKELTTSVDKVKKENNGHAQPEEPKANGNDMTEQALFNLTVGNRSLASANESLARSYELLLKMLSSEKRDQPISAELERRLTDLWLVIAEIGAGKRWESNEAAMQELNRYVVYPQSKTSGVDR